MRYLPLVKAGDQSISSVTTFLSSHNVFAQGEQRTTHPSPEEVSCGLTLSLVSHPRELHATGPCQRFSSRHHQEAERHQLRQQPLHGRPSRGRSQCRLRLRLERRRGGRFDVSSQVQRKPEALFTLDPLDGILIPGLQDYEGFDFGGVQGPYYEFPIEESGVYDGGSPGADRVVVTGDGEYAGTITHTGASGDDFVGCSGTS